MLQCQDCLEVLPSLMNNWQFPFLLLASRIFHDKRMESIVNRRLSLLIFLWTYVRIFSPVWTVMWRECDTQSVYQEQVNMILKNPLWCYNRMMSNIFIQSFKISFIFLYYVHILILCVLVPIGIGASMLVGCLENCYFPFFRFEIQTRDEVSAI
jgi:hypothetical protein